jgi:hypothetical protein
MGLREKKYTNYSFFPVSLLSGFLNSQGFGRNVGMQQKKQMVRGYESFPVPDQYLV